MLSVLFFLGVVTVSSIIFVLQKKNSQRPGSVGLANPWDSDCCDMLRGVTSRRAGSQQWIEPLRYAGETADAVATLGSLICKMPRAKLINATDRYLYVEFRSHIFRFVDDVEFLAEPETGRFHVRSFARVGIWDFGVNRERIETIRKAFEASQNQKTRQFMPPSVIR